MVVLSTFCCKKEIIMISRGPPRMRGPGLSPPPPPLLQPMVRNHRKPAPKPQSHAAVLHSSRFSATTSFCFNLQMINKHGHLLRRSVDAYLILFAGAAPIPENLCPDFSTFPPLNFGTHCAPIIKGNIITFVFA